jgi:hypothetical protein
LASGDSGNKTAIKLLELALKDVKEVEAEKRLSRRTRIEN